jgi:hypothetical protein
MWTVPEPPADTPAEQIGAGDAGAEGEPGA